MVNLMNTLTRWLKMTCEDTSPLISEMMDHTLPLSKRLRVRAHLAMCGMCRIYQKQLETIRNLARGLGREEPPLPPEIKLTEDCKQRMKDALKHSGES